MQRQRQMHAAMAQQSQERPFSWGQQSRKQPAMPVPNLTTTASSNPQRLLIGPPMQRSMQTPAQVQVQPQRQKPALFHAHKMTSSSSRSHPRSKRL